MKLKARDSFKSKVLNQQQHICFVKLNKLNVIIKESDINNSLYCFLLYSLIFDLK